MKHVPPVIFAIVILIGMAFGYVLTVSCTASVVNEITSAETEHTYSIVTEEDIYNL